MKNKLSAFGTYIKNAFAKIKIWNRKPKKIDFGKITIPDFNRTYTVTLKNTSEEDAPITIFGANQFLTQGNFGLPETVKVSVGESSYQEMLFESQQSPFYITGFRAISDRQDQLDEVLTIKKRQATGLRVQYPLRMSDYFSAFQFQSDIREAYPYELGIDGALQMSLNLLGASTLTFTFFVGKRVAISDLLHKEPTVPSTISRWRKLWLWIKQKFSKLNFKTIFGWFKLKKGKSDKPTETKTDLFGEIAQKINSTTSGGYNRGFTISLTNTKDEAVQINLFGANQCIAALNFGFPDGVTANVPESSYQEILFETQQNPFTISGFRIKSKNLLQLSQILTITKRDGNGDVASHPLVVDNYFSAYQFQSNIREVMPYNMSFSGGTYVCITLLPKTTVKFTFYIDKQVNWSEYSKSISVPNRLRELTILEGKLPTAVVAKESKLKNILSWAIRPFKKNKNKRLSLKKSSPLNASIEARNDFEFESQDESVGEVNSISIHTVDDRTESYKNNLSGMSDKELSDKYDSLIIALNDERVKSQPDEKIIEDLNRKMLWVNNEVESRKN